MDPIFSVVAKRSFLVASIIIWSAGCFYLGALLTLAPNDPIGLRKLVEKPKTLEEFKKKYGLE